MTNGTDMGDGLDGFITAVAGVARGLNSIGGAEYTNIQPANTEILERGMTRGAKAENLLIKAGILPEKMPHNYTYDQVREVVSSLGGYEESLVRGAVPVLSRLGISGPLQSAVFIKHHLSGEHEASIDRVITNEETGDRYAVLTYPEGEVPVKLDKLPEGARAGRKLRYSPTEGEFTAAVKRPKKSGAERNRSQK